MRSPFSLSKVAFLRGFAHLTPWLPSWSSNAGEVRLSYISMADRDRGLHIQSCWYRGSCGLRKAFQSNQIIPDVKSLSQPLKRS